MVIFPLPNDEYSSLETNKRFREDTDEFVDIKNQCLLEVQNKKSSVNFLKNILAKLMKGKQ